nr:MULTISPECIES: hypothetical protein [unclassified Pseudomonas]
MEVDRRKSELTFSMSNGFKKTYKSYDIYQCLGLVRAGFPAIKFLCKGAKLNVHTSSMSSQMSCGIVAYELRWGEPTEDEDLVRIFDYEDENLASTIEDQRQYYRQWIESLKK